jgi:hypothetical protein
MVILILKICHLSNKSLKAKSKSYKTGEFQNKFRGKKKSQNSFLTIHRVLSLHYRKFIYYIEWLVILKLGEEKDLVIFIRNSVL